MIASASLFSTVLVVMSAGAADAESWWHTSGKICPEGTVLRGEPPPKGADVGCVRPSGAYDGRRTTWQATCSPKAPCATPPSLRFFGEYRRGIEHGHWVFWHKNGRRGLEGDYFAGKKSGAWQRWDVEGKLSTLPYDDLAKAQAPEAVDDAILAALAAAKAVGNAELSRELDAASKDLRKGNAGAAGTSTSRGGGSAETIDAAVGVRSGAGADIPDVDIGSDNFGEGGEKAPAYVRTAVKRATTDVTRCYESIRQSHPKLSGEIAVRFTIAGDGHVAEVKVVRSTMTESMNQCVRDAVLKLRFDAHKESSPIEVISPWRFEAPKK